MSRKQIAFTPHHGKVGFLALRVSRPDPERSTRGNRRVPLNGSQFPETQIKARKAFDILALFKNNILPLFRSLLDLGNNSNF